MLEDLISVLGQEKEMALRLKEKIKHLFAHDVIIYVEYAMKSLICKEIYKRPRGVPHL